MLWAKPSMQNTMKNADEDVDDANDNDDDYQGVNAD
jgi:hypothetical protein